MTGDDPRTHALSEDAFFGARLRLLQPTRGHRFGHDAALLAASCPLAPNPLASRRALDVGAGVGAAGLAAAATDPALDMTLLEIDAGLVDVARRNIAANGLDARARALRADLLSAPDRRAAGLAPESFDLVLTNPPFLDAARARVSPDPARARAHAFGVVDPARAAPAAQGGESRSRPEAGLALWLRACLACLRPGGALRLIHRADALGAVLAALEGRAGAIRVHPVRARPGAAASRILVAATKGSRAPLAVEAGVTLAAPDGAPDPFAAALLEGRARLPG
jgi:tRNA1(Val) A37 N6-methylase TrmN6